MQTKLVEYDIKNTDIIIKWLWEQCDEISIAILMYLATEEVLPVYKLEDFFTMYNTNETGFHESLTKLKAGGLIDSYVANVNLNGINPVLSTKVFFSHNNLINLSAPRFCINNFIPQAVSK